MQAMFYVGYVITVLIKVQGVLRYEQNNIVNCFRATFKSVWCATE